MLDRVSPSSPRSGLLVGVAKDGRTERGGPSRWELPLDPWGTEAVGAGQPDLQSSIVWAEGQTQGWLGG